MSQRKFSYEWAASHIKLFDVADGNVPDEVHEERGGDCTLLCPSSASLLGAGGDQLLGQLPQVLACLVHPIESKGVRAEAGVRNKYGIAGRAPPFEAGTYDDGSTAEGREGPLWTKAFKGAAVSLDNGARIALYFKGVQRALIWWRNGHGAIYMKICLLRQTSRS